MGQVIAAAFGGMVNVSNECRKLVVL